MNRQTLEVAGKKIHGWSVKDHPVVKTNLNKEVRIVYYRPTFVFYHQTRWLMNIASVYVSLSCKFGSDSSRTKHFITGIGLQYMEVMLWVWHCICVVRRVVRYRLGLIVAVKICRIYSEWRYQFRFASHTSARKGSSRELAMHCRISRAALTLLLRCWLPKIWTRFSTACPVWVARVYGATNPKS